ncbi:MAG: hypothetical protein J6S09_07405 [Paludibacteraceae bacterium]|nr:hypothetical protein [Paludibacteraceae bacterium]
MKTEKELNEQIDILTEEYIKKIIEIGCTDFLMLMETEDLDDLEDYDEEQQIIIKESYNTPQYKQAKKIFEEYVEKRKPLLLQLVDNVEEEYNEIIYDYNEKFFNKFEDLQLGMSNIENNEQALPKFEMPEYEEYDGEDDINDIEDEDISDEQYDIFMEKMEDVFTDINNIFSNISDIEGNVNYYFPSELKIKEEIFSILKEIEEKTDTMAEKIMKLVNYME